MALPVIDPRRARQVQQEITLRDTLDSIDKKVAVISNKGGVGKSTMSVNLALELAKRGNKVGILDADITGPNIPKMLGVEGKRMEIIDKKLMPMQVENLKVVSMSFLLMKEDTAVIWRGPLKMGVLRQFLSDVNWGELDYLIIDLPPGTSDEALSIAQLITDLDALVAVTTPQAVSLLDVAKSMKFAKTMDLPVIGLVENMSGLTCPKCDYKIDVFGSKTGEKFAKTYKIPFLGRVPLHPEIAKGGDSGKSYLMKSDLNEPFAQIVDKIVSGVAEASQKRKEKAAELESANTAE